MCAGPGAGDGLLLPSMPSIQSIFRPLQPVVHIVGFGKTVHVFSSKQKPKKLTIYGSDFRCGACAALEVTSGQPGRWQTPALVPCSASMACMLLVERIQHGFTQRQPLTCKSQSAVVSARVERLLESDKVQMRRPESGLCDLPPQC